MRGLTRGPEGEGREGQHGLHRIAPGDKRDDPLPDEAALDGPDLRHDRRGPGPHRRRRPVHPAADDGHRRLHRNPADAGLLGLDHPRDRGRGDGRLLVHPVVGRGLRRHQPEGHEGRRPAAQADQRRRAREDQRRDHGAGPARPDAGLRHAQGEHRVRQLRPDLRDHAQAGRVPAGDARPEDGVRAGRRAPHRRRRASRRARRRSAAAPAPAPEVTIPAPVAPAPPSVDDKLRSLAKLRDDGIISAEEFEAKKTELLADL